jgi:hypothetical protein
MELKEEIAIYVERGRTAKEQEFHFKITDHAFILKLAVFFAEIN